MRAVGIVLAGGNSKRMRELSNKRAISAMPIAGSYRSIDFALSNMTNSHIQSVAVFTQYNSLALLEAPSSCLAIPVIAEKLLVSVVEPTSTDLPSFE